MPINHLRWLRMIQAGESVILAYQQCHDSVKIKDKLIQANRLSYEQAWKDYSLEIEALVLTTAAKAVFAEERWVYNNNFNHNKNERARQERKRRAAGKPLKQTSNRPEPSLIQQPGFDAANIRAMAAAVDETDNLPDEFDLAESLKHDAEDPLAHMTPEVRELYIKSKKGTQI